MATPRSKTPINQVADLGEDPNIDPLQTTKGFNDALNEIRSVGDKFAAAVTAKASGYSDAAAEKEAQRADRAILMSAVQKIITAVDAEKPVYEIAGDGRRFVTEAQLLHFYRQHFIAQGLCLLPNVVQVFPADASGTTVIEVEYALANSEGRLWSPCCRVAGAGNDRVAHQRGGSGDKGMARAMSAAWKEAMCRLLLLTQYHDPERFDLAHEQPIAGVRPSNQQQRQRETPLTMAQEEDLRERIIKAINNTSDLTALDHLIGHQRTKETMGRIGSRSRTLIEQAERDQRRGLKIADERYRRQADQPPDHGPDPYQAPDDVAGDGPVDEEYGDDDNRGGDPDDDIPF